MGKRLAIRVEMLPKDTNAWGSIFGGVIMGYMDVAGGDAARKYIKKGCATPAVKNCVTRAVRRMDFIAPIFVGDMAAFYTSVLRVGRTSITVYVEVIAERFDTAEEIKVGAATIVYVAVDEQGRPTPIKEEETGD